ncbi:hypothetical protein [Vitiosangium sp. GDMCC 1.1324]|uniref:hypothetical protein n=1 Tax=Vitiosangium sp. (strain GDMCC 1.1324) TaxID=2138576 RepID=UPI000D3B4866|nr:hypothetical protein [Vitiosangium sp. GDMCC 1.1324]PTL81766.1 hypothetical protein DAT35_22770 [Vitiosangium sp. GDMCC 1.1324]
MNRFLGPASLGLSVLALAVALLGSRGETVAPAPPPSEPPSASSSAEWKELERRVKNLEDTSLSLSRRMMLLEQRPVVSSDGGVVAAAPTALAAEVEQLRSEVRGLVAGEALSSEGGRQYLKDMVRSVQDEMRTEQRDVRMQQFQQAQSQAQAARSERLRQFVSEARLNYSQEQELTRRMQNEETQRQALFDAVRAGDKSPRDVRQEARQLREQTDKEVKALLDESQQAKYDEMRREERQAERPWGGRGQGPGPQGGGQP